VKITGFPVIFSTIQSMSVRRRETCTVWNKVPHEIDFLKSELSENAFYINTDDVFYSKSQFLAKATDSLHIFKSRLKSEFFSLQNLRRILINEIIAHSICRPIFI